jgi:hypothetical protein
MGEQVTFIKVGTVSDTSYPVQALAVVPGTSTDNVARAAWTLGVVMSVLLLPGRRLAAVRRHHHRAGLHGGARQGIPDRGPGRSNGCPRLAGRVDSRCCSRPPPAESRD